MALRAVWTLLQSTRSWSVQLGEPTRLNGRRRAGLSLRASKNEPWRLPRVTPYVSRRAVLAVDTPTHQHLTRRRLNVRRVQDGVDWRTCWRQRKIDLERTRKSIGLRLPALGPRLSGSVFRRRWRLCAIRGVHRICEPCAVDQSIEVSQISLIYQLKLNDAVVTRCRCHREPAHGAAVHL